MNKRQRKLKHFIVGIISFCISIFTICANIVYILIRSPITDANRIIMMALFYFAFVLIYFGMEQIEKAFKSPASRKNKHSDPWTMIVRKYKRTTQNGVI